MWLDVFGWLLQTFCIKSGQEIPIMCHPDWVIICKFLIYVTLAYINTLLTTVQVTTMTHSGKISLLSSHSSGLLPPQVLGVSEVPNV